MPKIRNIKIKNFRSIKLLDINVTDLSILVGNNDCGKSNILRALNLFFNGETDTGRPFDFNNDFNRFVETNKRAPEIVIELTLELPENYRRTNGDVIVWKKAWRKTGLWSKGCGYSGYRVTTNRRGREILTEVELPAKSNVHSLLSKVEFEYIPAIRSFDYIKKLRGRIYDVISKVSESNFRDQSSDFEQAISENVTELINSINTDLSEETRLRLPNDLTAIFESLDFLSGDKSISLNNRGDGIKGRYIPLILKFMADKKSELQVRGSQPYTFIWAYEEPENNLEYTRAQELAQVFGSLAQNENIQVVITTHSPVFYNLKKSVTICAAMYVSNVNGETEISTHANECLDEKMGVMPIIAPYIASAQAEIEAVRSELENTQEQINQQQLPVIFVEGECEYRIFSKILELCFSNVNNRILLVRPPARAGANYVTNMLRSWEYKTKHEQKDSRNKAAGLLDSDDEGLRAKERYLSDVNRPKHSTALVLSPTTEIQEILSTGINIPICLEEMWPNDWWEEADSNGWLEQRPSTSIIGNDLAKKLVEEDVNFSSLMQESWQIYISKKPNPDNKIEWVTHILEKPDDEFENGNHALIETCRELLRSIDVQVN